jgi:hypothetical protein
MLRIRGFPTISGVLAFALVEMKMLNKRGIVPHSARNGAIMMSVLVSPVSLLLLQFEAARSTPFLSNLSVFINECRVISRLEGGVES